jgi:hypothetical protein
MPIHCEYFMPRIYGGPTLRSKQFNIFLAQECSYPLSLTSTKDYCLGSSLLTSSTHALKKIVWYHDGRPVDSAIATQSLDAIGTAAATNIFLERLSPRATCTARYLRIPGRPTL